MYCTTTYNLVLIEKKNSNNALGDGKRGNEYRFYLMKFESILLFFFFCKMGPIIAFLNNRELLKTKWGYFLQKLSLLSEGHSTLKQYFHMTETCQYCNRCISI